MSKMVCKVCGSAYSFCPGCVKDMDKPRWMSSFDKEKCKEVFDALVANSAGRMTDGEALAIVERSGVRIASKSVAAHVERLRGKKDTPAVEEAKPEVVVVEEVKKEPEVEEKVDEKPLFKKNDEPSSNNEKNESGVEEKENKSIGSLFSRNNFSSNSRNKEKVKQDAAAINSVVEQLNEKQGF